jgi:hypothetical protein
MKTLQPISLQTLNAIRIHRAIISLILPPQPMLAAAALPAYS